MTSHSNQKLLGFTQVTNIKYHYGSRWSANLTVDGTIIGHVLDKGTGGMILVQAAKGKQDVFNFINDAAMEMLGPTLALPCGADLGDEALGYAASYAQEGETLLKGAELARTQLGES